MQGKQCAMLTVLRVADRLPDAICFGYIAYCCKNNPCTSSIQIAVCKC
jgi:hypothetical protein